MQRRVNRVQPAYGNGVGGAQKSKYKEERMCVAQAKRSDREREGSSDEWENKVWSYRTAGEWSAGVNRSPQLIESGKKTRLRSGVNDPGGTRH